MHLFLFKRISFFLTQFFLLLFVIPTFAGVSWRRGSYWSCFQETRASGTPKTKARLLRSHCVPWQCNPLLCVQVRRIVTKALVWPDFQIFYVSTIYWKLNLLFDRFCATQNTSLLIVWPEYWIYYTRIAPSALPWRAVGRIFGEEMIFWGVLERRSGGPLPE